MQILACQNIFKVHRAPDCDRQNKFFQSTTVSRHSSGKKGVQITRNHSINFDHLYNPYRLKELGSYEDKFSTPYKSLQTKQFPVYNCNAIKCIRLGQKKENCEISSAERSESTVTNYLKNHDMCSEGLQKLMARQKYYVTNAVNDDSFLTPSQIRSDMFGNMEKMSSGEDSFVSFPSQSRQSSVYFSIVSNRAN